VEYVAAQANSSNLLPHDPNNPIFLTEMVEITAVSRATADRHPGGIRMRGDASHPLLAVLLATLLSVAAMAHEGEEDELIGFDAQEGSRVPMDLTFTDETGAEVTLADLTSDGSRPLVLSLLYYDCKNQCTQVVVAAARTFGAVSRKAGTDYQLVMVSISPTETPEIAAEKKALAMTMVDDGFPQGGWTFLVGQHAQIDALAASIGFRYRKNGEDYDHPLGLVFVSPSGTVTSYVTGTSYLPAEVNLGIMGASNGVVTPMVAKVLRLCFSYNPASDSLVFQVNKVIGAVTLLVAGGFALFLILRSRKKRGGASAPSGGTA